LYGLKTTKTKQEKELSAIIAMTDSGWTTWEIRDKYGVLPPGDIRRWIAALAKDTGMVRELFEYKFEDETGCIGWNKIGNTLITALGDIKGSFEAGLDAACEMFQVKGNVIPVTLEDVHLGANYEALWETEAKVVYVTNIMADKGETTTYTITDLIDHIEEYAWEVIDYVLVNNGHISEELVAKYKEAEGKKPLKMKEWLDFSGKTYEVLEYDFVNESDVIRHDPGKLSKALIGLAQNQLELIK